MIKRIFCILIFLAFSCSGSYAADLIDYGDVKPPTQVDPAIFQQPRTLILIVDGQSMWGNFSLLTKFVPNPNVYELSIWDGKIYQSTGDPVMNMNGWDGRLSILPYLADRIIATGRADRVLICAINIGGTSAQQWSETGSLHDRKVHLMDILNGLGLTPNYCVSIQGQQDVYLGTSKTDYINQRISGLTAWRNLGMNAPIAVGVGVYWGGVSDIYPDRTLAIREGQIEAGLSGSNSGGPVSGVVSIGADDDTLGDSYRSERVHWNDLGRYYTVESWLPVFPFL